MITTVSVVMYALAVFLALVSGQLLEDRKTAGVVFGLGLTVTLFVAGAALQVAS